MDKNKYRFRSLLQGKTDGEAKKHVAFQKKTVFTLGEQMTVKGDSAQQVCVVNRSRKCIIANT